MCEDCYISKYGAPTIRNERVERAVRAIGKLYEVHPTGGLLHIVTDDWNLEDHHVMACSDMQGTTHMGGTFGYFDSVELEAFNAIEALTVDERASALGFADG